MSYYLRLFLSLHPGPSGAKPERRATWNLLAAFHWFLSRDKSYLYVFSLIQGVVVGEVIDNINFLLIWISIINSAPFTVFDFLLMLPKGLVLPPTWILLINSALSTFSAWFPPTSTLKRWQVFFSPNDVSKRPLVRNFIQNFRFQPRIVLSRPSLKQAQTSEFSLLADFDLHCFVDKIRLFFLLFFRQNKIKNIFYVFFLIRKIKR